MNKKISQRIKELNPSLNNCEISHMIDEARQNAYESTTNIGQCIKHGLILTYIENKKYKVSKL